MINSDSVNKKIEMCLLVIFCFLATLTTTVAQSPNLGPELRQRLSEKLGRPDPSIEDVKTVKKLDLRELGNNQLATLLGLDQFDNLDELDLSQAKLAKFDSSENFRGLPKLKILKFSQGRLDGAPPPPDLLRSQLKTFDKLEKCELKGNRLDKSFLDGLDMPRLTDLDLSDNQITDFNNVGNLDKLKRLSLHRNPLRKSPQGLTVLRALDGKELEFLDLSEPIGIDQASADVLLDYDDTGDPIHLPDLKDLNLKKTKFRRIHKLRTYTQLEKLNLSGNQITDTDLTTVEDPDGVLKYLNKIRLLDISDNPITDAEPIVRLAENKLGFSEKITKAPGIASAPSVNDPDLIVIATNTQLSSTEIQRLTELGVTVINDISHFSLHLVSGLNMISLPLDTGHNFTAKSFAQYLINSSAGGELDYGFEEEDGYDFGDEDNEEQAGHDSTGLEDGLPIYELETDLKTDGLSIAAGFYALDSANGRLVPLVPDSQDEFGHPIYSLAIDEDLPIAYLPPDIDIDLVETGDTFHIYFPLYQIVTSNWQFPFKNDAGNDDVHTVEAGLYIWDLLEQQLVPFTSVTDSSGEVIYVPDESRDLPPELPEAIDLEQLIDDGAIIDTGEIVYLRDVIDQENNFDINLPLYELGSNIDFKNDDGEIIVVEAGLYVWDSSARQLVPIISIEDSSGQSSYAVGDEQAFPPELPEAIDLEQLIDDGAIIDTNETIALSSLIDGFDDNGPTTDFDFYAWDPEFRVLVPMSPAKDESGNTVYAFEPENGSSIIELPEEVNPQDLIGDGKIVRTEDLFDLRTIIYPSIGFESDGQDNLNLEGGLPIYELESAVPAGKSSITAGFYAYDPSFSILLPMVSVPGSEEEFGEPKYELAIADSSPLIELPVNFDIQKLVDEGQIIDIEDSFDIYFQVYELVSDASELIEEDSDQTEQDDNLVEEKVVPKAPAQSTDSRISLIIRYHYRIDPDTGESNGGFETYLPDIDQHEGFLIGGGEGYIVNLVSDAPAHTVNISGRAWTGENSPISTPPAESPSSMGLEPWAFVVTGQLPAELPVTNHYSISLKDGDRQLTKLENSTANFRLALVDMSRQPVVHEGQQLRLEITDSQQQLVGYSDINLRAKDLAQAYIQPNIQYNQIPGFTRLLQNYPNPFNPETWIPFELNQASEVSISVYDAVGQLIRQLELGYQPAGIYSSREKSVYWDGKNAIGETVATGLYFYNLKAGDYSETRRMVILK